MCKVGKSQEENQNIDIVCQHRGDGKGIIFQLSLHTIEGYTVDCGI